MQIQQGTAVPVTHGTTPLQADGTLLGRRLAALIALRDHARRVLQSQNEGWPETQRHEARRALNRVYDRFVAAYRKAGGLVDLELFDGEGQGFIMRKAGSPASNRAIEMIAEFVHKQIR